MKWVYVNSKRITYNGETLNLLSDHTEDELSNIIKNSGSVKLTDGTNYAFKRAGGTATTTGGSTALLSYIFSRDNLYQGTELTEADESIPNRNGNKGFLTSSTASPLIDFYKAFAYNDDNYKLVINSPNVEVSFLCSDRRYGVAGSRRGWSPYFNIRDLVKTSFTDIQNVLVGSDTSPEYFFKAKVEVRATGDLFITFIDGHSGVNLYGAILNIRHRIIN